MSSTHFNPPRIRSFRRRLLAWFDIHKRDLPWRRSRDPYAIWVSEIMLQQTRVAAVLDHYGRWMTRFPTVSRLASAPEDEVLAAWSGLGYYRRARFLHQASKVVLSKHNGELPRTAAQLLALPGIGAYTSAAIASIAFGEQAAVVDGNVERVLLRQAGLGEVGAAVGTTSLNAAAIQALASELLDPARPGDYNQAVMELGATVCLPRNPLCLQCPVLRTCRTRGEHPTAARKPGVTAEAGYALARRSVLRDEVLLALRPPAATVMPGMWELPRLDAPPSIGKPSLVLRHAIMQTSYRVSVFPIATHESPPAGPAQQWISLEDLPAMPLTGLARKILLRLGLLLRA